MKRATKATVTVGIAALLSLAACGGGEDGMDTGMAADTGFGATMPAPAPAPMDTMMPDSMMRDSMMRDSMARDTMPPPGT